MCIGTTLLIDNSVTHIKNKNKKCVCPRTQHFYKFILLPGINEGDKHVHESSAILNALRYVGLDPATEKGHW